MSTTQPGPQHVLAHQVDLGRAAGEEALSGVPDHRDRGPASVARNS